MNKPSIDWRAPYSEFETNEEALIRMFNDPLRRLEYPHHNSGFLKGLAAEFGTTRMAVNKKLGKLRAKNKVGYRAFDGSEPKVVTADKKYPPKDVAERFLKIVIDSNKLLNLRDVRQEEVNPVITWKQWVGLIVGGDWHFEHYRTNLEAIIADLKLIGSTPNLYYGFNGDLGDFIDLRFMELENETIDIPVRVRYEMIEYLVSMVPNMLFMVCGCHDNWVRTRARYDIIEQIQKKIMGYYLGFGGTVNLTVGSVHYRIAAVHKYGFESQTNPFHPNYKYLQKADGSADIVCISHRHDITGCAYVHVQDVPKVLIRSGSHQYKTNYAWKEGFRGAIARYPMVLLNGTAKRMITVSNFREGLPLLKMLNDNPKYGDELVEAGTQMFEQRKP